MLIGGGGLENSFLVGREIFHTFLGGQGRGDLFLGVRELRFLFLVGWRRGQGQGQRDWVGAFCVAYSSPCRTGHVFLSSSGAGLLGKEGLEV